MAVAGVRGRKGGSLESLGGLCLLLSCLSLESKAQAKPT